MRVVLDVCNGMLLLHTHAQHIQAANKLDEPSCVVRCRKVDVDIVKSVLEPARAKFQKEFGKPAPSLSVDETKFLPPPPTEDEELESWYVVMHWMCGYVRGYACGYQ